MIFFLLSMYCAHLSSIILFLISVSYISYSFCVRIESSRIMRCLPVSFGPQSTCRLNPICFFSFYLYFLSSSVDATSAGLSQFHLKIFLFLFSQYMRSKPLFFPHFNPFCFHLPDSIWYKSVFWNFQLPSFIWSTHVNFASKCNKRPQGKSSFLIGTFCQPSICRSGFKLLLHINATVLIILECRVLLDLLLVD